MVILMKKRTDIPNQELPKHLCLLWPTPLPDMQAIDDGLMKIIQDIWGFELSKDAAEHEWEERFKPMRFKRIGPSIIPTEVVVPLKA